MIINTPARVAHGSSRHRGNNWRGLESGGIIGWLRSPGVLGGVRSRPPNLKLAIPSTPCAIIGSSSCEESTLRPLGCSLSTSYHRPDQSPDIAYQAIRERSVIPSPIPCQSHYLLAHSCTLGTRWTGSPSILPSTPAWPREQAHSVANLVEAVPVPPY